MGKLSKAQNVSHQKAMDLINSDKPLTYDQKLFCYENYNEAATTNIRSLGSFHTPLDLAWDFSIEVGNTAISILDLCAGTGILAFTALNRGIYERLKMPLIVCVETNEEYCAIGKRLLPEAIWINGDALTVDVLQYLRPWQKFEVSISNPPFGPIKDSINVDKYTGGNFEFKVIERAAQVSNRGVFLLPQQSSPFRYSGAPYYQEISSRAHQKFFDQTGIVLSAGCGIDTSIFADQWKNTKIVCEVCCTDFIGENNRMKPLIKLMKGDTLQKIGELNDNSVDLVFFNVSNRRSKDPQELIQLLTQFERVKTGKGSLCCVTGHKLTVTQIKELFAGLQKGSVVLDPFMWDGRTGKICMELGIKYIGIEQGETYELTKALLKEHWALLRKSR